MVYINILLIGDIHICQINEYSNVQTNIISPFLNLTSSKSTETLCRETNHQCIYH